VSYGTHYARELRRRDRFFSPDVWDVRSNEVNSRRARHWAHQGVRSCQCQAIPAMGGVTTRRSDASSLMSLFARLAFFHLRGEAYSGIHPFEVCITETHCFFGSKRFLGPSPSLCDLKRKDCFSKHFSFSSGSFKSALEVFWCSVLHDCQLLKGFFWIYSMPSSHSSCRLRSLELLPLGQQCRPIIRVVDSDPSNYRP
jgi:hypothetical protein